MIFNQDASYYGQAIKNGDYRCTDLVEAVLENTKHFNSKLNAITETYPDSALQQAKKMDQCLAQMDAKTRQTLSPFYGVPYLLKDLGQFYQGHPTTAGSSLLLKSISQHTDRSLQQGLDAGLIYWGRSNVPEFGLKTVSDSKYFGKVNNPMNLSYNPGGSSGGAAAAVKAGIAPIAAASDAGGSIRVPASDTGLIGLKPSRGRIAQGPNRYRPVNGLATSLVVSRSVRDVFHSLKTFQANQKTAIHHLPLIEAPTLESLEKTLKIAYSYQHPRGLDTDPEAIIAMKKTLNTLKNLGHKVIEIDLPVDYEAVMEAYYTIMATETGQLVRQIEQNQTTIEFDQLDPLTWVTYQFAPNVPASAYIKFSAQQDLWVETMQTLHQTYDLYLTPTCSSPAVNNTDLVYPEELLSEIHQMDQLNYEAQWDVTKKAFDFTYLRTSYCPLLNITGQPGISLPVHETDKGLAMGVHFAAAIGEEYRLLQIANSLEEVGLLHTDICSVTI